jgi:starch synthase (maltosyl-transferring)
MYLQRYALAATLSSNIGIYGPVFEQQIDAAIPGKEEYYMSEKFQVCHYNWNIENKLTTLIGKINEIRHNHESYQQTNNIKFCHMENEKLIAFYKWNDDRTDETLTIISLDQYYMQSGHVQVPLQDLGIQHGHKVEVHDLVTGNSYNWYDEWNYVELHPTLPFHIFKIKK